MRVFQMFPCFALLWLPHRTEPRSKHSKLYLKSTWLSIVCSSMQTAQWAMGWLAEPVHHMRQTYIWSLQWLIYCQRWHYFHTLVSIYSCFRAVLGKILKKMLLSLAARHHLYCPVRAFFCLPKSTTDESSVSEPKSWTIKSSEEQRWIKHLCNSFNIIILNIADYNLLIVCIQHYSCDTGACLVCYINFLSVLDVKQAALLNRFLVNLSFLLKSSLSLRSNCPSLQLRPLQACNTHINIHTPRHMLVSLVLLLLLALSICSLSL